MCVEGEGSCYQRWTIASSAFIKSQRQVFGFCNQVRLKMAYSAAKKLDIILSRHSLKALLSL